MNSQKAGATPPHSAFAADPKLVVLAGVVGIAVVWSWIFGPAGQSPSLRASIPSLMKEYGGYLARIQPDAASAKLRKQQVSQRLQRAAVKVELGDLTEAKRELFELMLFDRDGRSPVYQQCSQWLQSLPE